MNLEKECPECTKVESLLETFKSMVDKHKDDFPPHLFSLYVIGFCVDVMQICCKDMPKAKMKKLMLEAFKWSTERYEQSKEVDNADSK